MTKNEQAGRIDKGTLPGLWVEYVAWEQVLREKIAKIIAKIEVD